MKGGFVGVDIFFVISGFLISNLIFENLDRGSFNFSDFFARRIVRTFPSLLLILAASFTFGWFALFADEFKLLGKYIAAGAGFFSNYALLGDAALLNKLIETNPLSHLWSVSIGLQFLIIWPLLLWLAWKKNLNLLTLTGVFATISLTLNIKLMGEDAGTAFYSIQTRLWEFLLGSLLAWFTFYKPNSYEEYKLRIGGWLAKAIYRNPPTDFQFNLSNALSWLGTLLLGFGVSRISQEPGGLGPWVIIPVLGAVLIILAGPNAWMNRTVLSSKVAVWFGLICFPLYLWHWPILSFATMIEGDVPSRSIRVAAVVLSIVLAWLTYKLVERPTRLLQSGKITAAVLVVLMACVGFFGFKLYKSDGFQFRPHVQAYEPIKAQLVGPVWEYSTNEICLRKYPLPGSDKAAWRFCTASDEAPPTMLLLGNSFANHLYPGVISHEKLNHHSVLSIGTCDPGWVEEADLSTEVTMSPCSGRRPLDQQNLINGIVTNQKSIKFAIFGGLSITPDENYISKLKKRIDFLESNGIKVIIFTPHVSIDYDIKDCYARPFATPKKDCRIPSKAYDDLKMSFKPLVDRISESNPGVLFFDQNSVFCNDEFCDFKLPVLPAFRDEYVHFSKFASEQVMIEFVAWAKLKIPEILN